MVSLQGQLVEDPEQVVTTSLIVEIVERAGYPVAELAGMGGHLGCTSCCKDGSVGVALFFGHALECGLLAPWKYPLLPCPSSIHFTFYILNPLIFIN